MTLLYRISRAYDSLLQDGPIVYHGMTDPRCSGGSFVSVPVLDHHLADMPGVVSNLFYEYYSGTEHRCAWLVSWVDYAIALWLLVMMPLIWYLIIKSVVWCINFAASPLGNGFVSLWLVACRRWFSPVVPDASVYRNRFATVRDIQARVPKQHSHPVAAKFRNASTYFMDHVCSLIGRSAYYPQMSKTDERKGRRGARYYHWVKDLNVGFSSYDPTEHEVLCFVDVDMYLDMPELLASDPKMCLISTFQPTSVATGNTNNYAFTFNKDDEVVFTVSGGAEFKHPVWNYGTDVLLASTTRYWGLMHYVTAYHVERRFLDDHHQVLFLVPSVCVRSPLINVSRWISGHILSRLKVVRGDSLVLNIMSKDGMARSVGQVGKYIAANIRAVDDDVVSVQSIIAKVDITPASVRSILPEADVTTASILTAHHRAQAGGKFDTVFPMTQSVYNYQFDPKNYDPDAKATLMPFMSPFMLGAYAPTNCISNDKAAVDGRIIKIRPDPDLQVDAFRLQTMDEFVRFLVPDSVAGTLHPDDVADVERKQDRPQQRAILRQAELAGGTAETEVVSTFIKKEAYGGVKDPRIITTIPGRTKLQYSRFVAPFSREVMRKTKWYAFGKKPCEIADIVADITSSSNSVLASDAARMDGRVTQPSRDVEYQAMLRAYHREHHVELLDSMDKQSHRKAVTPHGVWYETGTARLSGSSETADFNSLDDAEMAYHAYRRMGLTPEQAWKKLGIYGGDDGLSGDLDPAALERSFQQVGQVAEIQVFKRGESGVNFLARFYGPDIWHGDANSICDIPRQLSKLHTTVGMSRDVLPLDKLVAKALNYCLTDANTPVIGPICQGVMALTGAVSADMSLLRGSMIKAKPELLRALSWWSRFDRSVQWPNEVGDWAHDMLRAWLPTIDIARLERWLSVLNPGNVLTPPLIVEPAPVEAKAPAVVNGEVVGPRQPVGEPVGQAAPARPLQACRDFASPDGCNRKKCKFAHVKKE